MGLNNGRFTLDGIKYVKKLTSEIPENNNDYNETLLTVDGVVDLIRRESVEIFDSQLPSIDISHFDDEIFKRDIFNYTPKVFGSNLKFSLENEPNGMVIDEDLGTVNYTGVVGEYNNIIIHYRTNNYQNQVSFNLSVKNIWQSSPKLINYMFENRYNINNEWRTNRNEILFKTLNETTKPKKIKKF